MAPGGVKLPGKVWLVLKLTLSALLLLLLLRRQSLSELRAAWQQAAAGPALLAVALLPAFIGLRALRWKYLLRVGGLEVRFFDALRSYLTALPFAVLTPARAGEMTRAFFVPGGDRPQLIGLLVAEKLADAGAVALMLLGGATLILGRTAQLLYTAMVLLMLLLMLRQTAAPRFAPRLDGSFLRRMIDAVRLFDRTQALFLVALTLAGYSLLLCQYFLLLRAHQPVGWPAVLVVYPAVLFANLFPFTLGGLGAREWAAAVLAPEFGIAASAAINATFGIYLLDLLVPALAGGLLVLSLRARSVQ